ncbi:MAG TPA: recombination protein RecR [Candidatus Avibacteroides faecavium]|nr:recombination protein RecR [Candidatus Avibacteroides faecavium]
MYRQIPSARLERAVEELSKLPGIGGRTAMRLALFLLKQDDAFVASFVSAISDMKKNVKYCKVCNNISDTDICSICSDKGRDGALICVVENIKDVMSIEATMQYNGLYHVLGGLISPMDGIGPSDIAIDSLVARVSAGGVNEVILALSPTMEGDTTNFFIYRKLSPLGVKVTALSRGLSVGDELEYTDEVTLGRSIINRVNFETNI